MVKHTFLKSVSQKEETDKYMKKYWLKFSKLGPKQQPVATRRAWRTPWRTRRK